MISQGATQDCISAGVAHSDVEVSHAKLNASIFKATMMARNVWATSFENSFQAASQLSAGLGEPSGVCMSICPERPSARSTGLRSCPRLQELEKEDL